MANGTAIHHETLTKALREVRLALCQIISRGEIIGERASDENNQELQAHLRDTLDVADTTLRLIKNKARENGTGISTSVLRERILEQSARAFISAQRVQQLSGDLPWARADAEKLMAAQHLLQKAISALGIDSTAELPEKIRDEADSSRPPVNSEPRGGAILVVDDNEDNREVLSRRLLRDGHEVMTAETGNQALRMLQRYEFDIVLLDIMMPGMDGYAVLERFKKDPALLHLPVIMITAVDEMESVVRCIELGADDYLLKPFNPVLLRARINALLEQKRLRDAEKRKTAELERLFAEVETERRKTRELLLNILPHSVAEELQTAGSVRPMYFEDVTIVFADIVGFTLSTEQLPADELVDILHEYFTAFDQIISRNGLEKLKTIGDCYMFAGGIPVRKPSHPVDSVLAAFEMVNTMKKISEHGRVNWQLRIGIHTGPVIAGVVGINKFAFDIWGDAVNFSSRMEACGAPGRINLSASSYARVKDFFACEKREKIRIKDGREVDTYFVNGIAPGLLEHKKLAPAHAFEQRYHTYFRSQPHGLPAFLLDQAFAACDRSS